MFLGFISTKLATNTSYSPLITFLYYFTNLSYFLGKLYPPPIFDNKWYSNSHLLCQVCENTNTASNNFEKF